ncbi:hypothetical protein ACFE04_010183 [Oxalis oulophora]
MSDNSESEQGSESANEDEESLHNDFSEEVLSQKEDSTTKASKTSNSCFAKTITEEDLSKSSSEKRAKGIPPSLSTPFHATNPQFVTPSSNKVQTQAFTGGVPTFTPSSSSAGIKPTNIVVNEDRVNYLVKLIASSAKKGEKNDAAQDDELAATPVDFLISEVSFIYCIVIDILLS